jgi:hypothetical protein
MNRRGLADGQAQRRAAPEATIRMLGPISAPNLVVDWKLLKVMRSLPSLDAYRVYLLRLPKVLGTLGLPARFMRVRLPLFFANALPRASPPLPV